MKHANIAICGAGIAGIATAWSLAVKYRRRKIVLIDKNQPMSLTTSKSGENFRDYWPHPCMTALTRHSIAMMQSLADDSDNTFEMRYSGYDFVSEAEGREIFPSESLMDPDNIRNVLRITGSENIRASHPHLSDSIRQIVRFKQAGAIDVHALGSLLLTQARKAGVELYRASIEDIEHLSAGYRLDLVSKGTSASLEVEKLVLTPGPFINELAEMLGITLPVESVLQRKFVIPDPQNIIPRDMPFTIFADSQCLDWSAEDKVLIAQDPEYRWLLDEFPPGLHIKPEGVGNIKLGWAYNREPETPKWELSDDFDFPNITLRGASRFIPGLASYVENPPTPIIQFSGYYTRTAENLPLIGPLELENLFTVSALSGFGTMAACAAGDLCAAWMSGGDLREYAAYFHPGRYRDAALMTEINQTGSDGQL
jgi:glycine/D-amino acid oxidase-like deaminating enzyme